MLVLSRKERERFRVRVPTSLGDLDVWVTVIDVVGGRVRLGVEAPKEVQILRAELLEGEPGAGGAGP